MENVEQNPAPNASAPAERVRERDSSSSELDPNNVLAVPAGVSAGSFPRIPGFTILKQIGFGGMGIVFEARQHEPERFVALKVLRQGLPSRDLLRRFQRETQILARLHHRSIAQIYQVGSFEGQHGEQQPYFVMELVAGLQLLEHCKAKRFGISDRVEMLIRICEGVEHAHGLGIIHRDLKPDNVLVTDSREPKILDFGVARVVGGESMTTMLTEAAAIVGTLAYMSPEQVSNQSDEIDSSSDVYSLGVIAYELLTGELPLDVRSTSLANAVSKITTIEPEPLSSRNPRCRGDLETIVGKALEKEKGRRYRTAAAMAADLRRFQSHEPIKARPPSTFYQLRKFAARNRVLVGGVVATIVALAAGLVGTMSQAALARRSAARAEERRVDADRARETAEREQYLADVAFASLAVTQNRVFEAESALLKAPANYRGWEWGYLWRASHPEVAVMLGHTAGIRDVEYSPDGTHILSVSDDKTGRLWNPQTGKCVAVLEGHKARVLFGEFSPLGDRLATASDDHTARIWNSSGALSHVLALHSAPVNKARFSPDGLRIVTVSDDNDARLWDAYTGECIARLEGHSDSVWDVEFDWTGEVLATASDDKTARLWDVKTGRPLMLFGGHEDQVNAVRFHPSQKRLATVSEDAVLKIWDYETALPARSGEVRIVSASSTSRLPMEKPRWASFTENGSSLFIASRMGRFATHDSSTGDQLGMVYDSRDEVEQAFFLDHPPSLLVAQKNSELKLYRQQDSGEFDLKGGPVFRGHKDSVSCIAAHPNEATFASGSADGSVRVWPLQRELRSLRTHSSKGQIVALGFDSQDRVAHLVDGKRLNNALAGEVSGALIQLVIEAPDLSGGAISSDATRAVTIHASGEMKIWDLRSADLPPQIIPTDGPLESIAYSPDGMLLVGGGPGSAVTLWRAADGRRVRRYVGHDAQVIQAACEEDSNRIISISADETARVWNSAGEVEIARIDLGMRPSSIALNQPTRRAAIALADNTVLILSLENFDVLTRLETHQKGYEPRVCFTPDGSRLVTCTSENPLKIWDASDFREVMGLDRPASITLAISFNATGRYLGIGLDSGAIFVYDAGPGGGNLLPNFDHGYDWQSEEAGGM